MVDSFDLSREQPHKEWWRERKIAPATFFGFPDVTKHNLRGGSLYVEKMDSVTLAVLADKCYKESIWHPEIWTKFSWRAQQIASRTNEPDLCYIFRAFSRMDWFDQNLLTTYLGRLDRRLYAFQLPDVAVLLEAFANQKFRQGPYLQKALTHLGLLLQHRDDASTEDLARGCAALRALRPLPLEFSAEVSTVLNLLAEALLMRELSELELGSAISVIDCYVTWGLAGRERVDPASAPMDLCWALVRELRGKLRAHAQEQPEDLAKLAMAMALGGIAHEEVWEELVSSLQPETHRLSGPAAAAAAFGVARGGQRPYQLFDSLARRLGENRGELTALDAARAAGGFLRHWALAEQVVLRGPIYERALELGIDSFDGEALALMLDAVRCAPPNAWGLDALVPVLLEALPGRLDEFSVEQMCLVVRSLGHLRPERPELLEKVLDRAQAAVAEATADAAADWSHAGFTPKHVAMLTCCIAALPEELLPSAPSRLQALLPQVAASLEARPAPMTVARILGSLVRCPSQAAGLGEVLGTCSQRLTERACDLTARKLVSLVESLVALEPKFAEGQQDKLLRKVVAQLDMKRYDLKPGVLWRAAKALEAYPEGRYQLELEPRDRRVEATVP